MYYQASKHRLIGYPVNFRYFTTFGGGLRNAMPGMTNYKKGLIISGLYDINCEMFGVTDSAFAAMTKSAAVLAAWRYLLRGQLLA